jgi:hypothetical protein
VWDPVTGRRRAVLTGHTDWVAELLLDNLDCDAGICDNGQDHVSAGERCLRFMAERIVGSTAAGRLLAWCLSLITLTAC